jgi:hypothetical protein
MKKIQFILLLLASIALPIQAKPKVYDHVGTLIFMWLPQFKDEHRYTSDSADGTHVDFACSSSADSTHCRDLNMLEEFVFDDGSYGPVVSMMGLGMGNLSDPLADALIRQTDHFNVSDMPGNKGFKQHVVATFSYRLAVKGSVKFFCVPATKNGKQHGEGCYVYAGKNP